MAFSLCNTTSNPATMGGEAADETQDGVHSKLRQPWALWQHLCSHPWVSTPHPRPTWARTEGNYGTVMARSWSVYVGITEVPFVGLFQPHCHLLEICRNTSSRCTSLMPTSYRLRLLMGVSSSKTHWRLGGGWAENWQ